MHSCKQSMFDQDGTDIAPMIIFVNLCASECELRDTCVMYNVL